MHSQEREKARESEREKALPTGHGDVRTLFHFSFLAGFRAQARTHTNPAHFLSCRLPDSNLTVDRVGSSHFNHHNVG